MWRDIALANGKNLNKALQTFVKDLQRIQKAIASGDSRSIEEFFAKAKALRDGWHSEMCASIVAAGRRSSGKPTTQE
jgi:hypothetical protein